MFRRDETLLEGRLSREIDHRPGLGGDDEAGCSFHVLRRQRGIVVVDAGVRP